MSDSESVFKQLQCINADINECANGQDQCEQNCHNTVGSYTCSCWAGYRLDSNGQNCSGMSHCPLSLLNISACTHN